MPLQHKRSIAARTHERPTSERDSFSFSLETVSKKQHFQATFPLKNRFRFYPKEEEEEEKEKGEERGEKREERDPISAAGVLLKDRGVAWRDFFLREKSKGWELREGSSRRGKDLAALS